MPTSSLTPDGLKRYSRWLAVQKAKGRVPSSTEVSAFLQGEIEANISQDTQREKLSLSREEVTNQRDFYDRRLDLLEDEQDYTKRANTIRGISEIAKLGLAANTATDGALWEGAKGLGGAVWDYGSDLLSGGADAGTSFLDTMSSTSELSEFSGAFDVTEIIDDIFPDMSSIWDIF